MEIDLQYSKKFYVKLYFGNYSMKYLLFITLSILTFVLGCSPKVPNCDDTDVINTVKQIATRERGKELKQIFTKENSNDIKIIIDYYKSEGSSEENKEFAELLEKMYKSVLDRNFDVFSIGRLSGTWTFSLNSIVTNKKDPDSSSCNCGATITWSPLEDAPKRETDIKYDVQYTDNATKYVVTVYGLSDLDLFEDDENDK